jgi:uncharacterized cupredoxin-like copper-binding protein
VAALAALAGAACGGRRPPASPVVRAWLRDFTITASRTTLPAGSILFRIHNWGPDTHEFVVVRTDLPADRLPLQADGLTVDEESPRLHPVGADESVEIEDTDSLLLRLPPGHYVVFCNLEGHYLGGMHLALEVDRGAAP